MLYHAKKYTPGKSGKLNLKDTLELSQTEKLLLEKEAAFIEDVQSNGYLKVYPNPATQCIKIESTLQKGTYEIKDMSGKVVLQGQFNLREEINITNLKPGLYFVTMEGEKVLTSKFIKQ